MKNNITLNIQKLWDHPWFRTAVIISAITLVYMLAGLSYMGEHLYIGETDTIFFFGYVRDILNAGGIWGTFKGLFNGTFTPANQHPIFPMIISLFFERNFDYFINIKILNLFTGLFFVYLFYFLIRKESGELHAIVAVCLLLINDIFFHQTTMVSCEPLLIIFSSLSFYFLIKGLDDNRFWILAGLFTGLTYMTKASGLFIIFGFGLFLLFDVRFRFWILLKNRYLWLFLAVFIVIALPLLVRNTIVYKFPLYNYNVDVIAMDEDWAKTENRKKFADIFKKDPSENIVRFGRGLVKEFRILIHSLYSFSIHYVPKFTSDKASLPRKIFAVIIALLIFIMGIGGFIQSQWDKRKKMLTGFLFIGFYLPLSWYSINAPNRRYILPAMLLILAFAAHFIVIQLNSITVKGPFIAFKNKIFEHGLFNRIDSRLRGNVNGGEQPSGKGMLFVIVLVLLLFSIIYPSIKSIPHPRTTYRIEDGYHELAAYLQKNLGPGETFLKKSGHNYPFGFFYPEVQAKNNGRKVFKDIAVFNAFIKSRPEIKFLLVDAEEYRMIKNIITPYIENSDEKGFTLIKELPGWEVAMDDKNLPCDYILLKRKPGN